MSTGAPAVGFRPRGRRARARAGDPEAFAALYARHEQELFRYCRSILRSEEDARDALQNAMVKAFTALQTERRDLALRPWLFRIAHNEAISLVRRRPQTTELDETLGGAEDAVHDSVELRERLTHLRADLQDLPERQRGALVMRELSGLSHEEIGAALGTSARAVKQTLYEARSSLADCAEGRAMRCEAVQQALSDGDGRVSRTRRMRAHLRDCRTCERFRIALVERPVELAALSPAVPLLGASGLLALLEGETVAGGLVGAAGGAAGVVGSGAGVAGTAAGVGGGLGTTLAAAGGAKLVAVAATVALAGGTAIVAGPSLAHRDSPGSGTTTTAPGGPGGAPGNRSPSSSGAAAGPGTPGVGAPGAGAPAKTGATTGAGGPTGTTAGRAGSAAPGSAKADGAAPGASGTKATRDAANADRAADRAAAKAAKGARGASGVQARTSKAGSSKPTPSRPKSSREMGATKPSRRPGAARAAMADRRAQAARAAASAKAAADARRAKVAKDAAAEKAARAARAAADAAAATSGKEAAAKQDAAAAKDAAGGSGASGSGANGKRP